MRARVVILAASLATVGLLAACADDQLNPQPLPPNEEERASGPGGSSSSGGFGTGTGGTSGDPAEQDGKNQPPAPNAAVEGGVDGGADGSDASDAKAD